MKFFLILIIAIVIAQQPFNQPNSYYIQNFYNTIYKSVDDTKSLVMLSTNNGYIGYQGNL